MTHNTNCSSARRSFLLLLALLLLLPSCGKVSSESSETETVSADTDAEQTEETKIQSNLPDTDWQGKEFLVLGQTDKDGYAQFSTHEIDAAELTGDALNDAVFNRNMAIEEKYNVIISADETAHRTPETLTKLVAAGEDLYNISFCVSEQIGGVVVSGNFQDMTELPYIDYEADWWNADVNQQVSVANKLYFTTSDFALSDKQRVNVLMYNKDLLKDFSLPDPIAMVREGTWTVDVMTEWVELVGADVDGDGTMTDADRYGLVMDSYTAFKTFTYAAGGRIVAKDSADLPTLVMNSEEMLAAIDKVVAMTCRGKALFCDDFNGKVDYNFWSVSGNVFKAGRALFMNGFTHSLASLSDSEINYNVIPYPKLNEAQEKYYTLADKFAMLFGIPVTCADVDFTAFMLEALAYESTETTLYTYYDISCKRKYMYDETGSEMLDITFSGIVYDPALIYNWGTVNFIIADTIPKKKENVFTSEYASKEKAALAAMEKTIEQFTQS